MKTRFSFLAFLGAIILLSSCKTNTDLNSSALIQKRRYTKGFHVNLKKPNPRKAETIPQERYSMDPMTPNQNLSVASANTHSTKELETYPYPVEQGVTEEKNPNQAVAPVLKSTHEKLTSEAVYLDATPSYVAPMAPLPVPPPNTDLNFVLILILTILIPPLGIGLVFGISTEFWLSLILTLLFYFPGLIYSLIILLQVY
jgi:uncharacterized membrane protein YqaE (UPF0057 family)